jgi:hypothetical protein
MPFAEDDRTCCAQTGHRVRVTERDVPGQLRGAGGSAQAGCLDDIL